MWARLKCVAEWISRERGNRSWLGSIHKDSDISWGITIVDVMPAGSAKAKGKRGVGSGRATSKLVLSSANPSMQAIP